MIKLAQSLQRIDAGTPPHPVRTFELRDTYVDEVDKAKPVLDATEKFSNISDIIAALLFSASISSGAELSLRKPFSAFFTNLAPVGTSMVLNRAITFVHEIEDRTLHVLGMGWSVPTRTTELQRNLNLANYLAIKYSSHLAMGRQTRIIPEGLIYSRMTPVIAGTMLYGQGTATQNNLVQMSRQNNGLALSVLTQSDSHIFAPMIRHEVFNPAFYTSDGFWGFGIQNLRYLDSHPFLQACTVEIIKLRQCFSEHSISVPLINLVSCIPMVTQDHELIQSRLPLFP